jgi:hypothetical protein
MAAVEGAHIDSMRVLIDRGADINPESNMFPGETALTTALRTGNAKVIEML